MQNKNVYPFHSQDEIRAQARTWVLRFNSDDAPTPEEVKAFRQWANISSTHLNEIKRAETLWAEADCLSELAVNVPSTSNRVNRKGKKQGAKLWARKTYFTAAMAFCLMAFPVLFLISKPESNIIENGYYTTAIGEQSTLRLKDSSVIQLDTNSEVEVSYSQNSRKIKLLKGKAYFQVAKNPKRPFEVYTKTGVVRAVGTAFSVSLSEHDIKVSVNEGKVAVARIVAPAKAQEELVNVKSKTVIPQLIPAFTTLGAGQSVIFNDQHEKVSELDSNDILKEFSWQKGILIFTGEPLIEVIQEVSRYTEAQIEISDPFIKQRPIGGRFKVGELDALLNSLEIGFGIEVTHISNKHIVLKAIKSS